MGKVSQNEGVKLGHFNSIWEDLMKSEWATFTMGKVSENEGVKLGHFNSKWEDLMKSEWDTFRVTRVSHSDSLKPSVGLSSLGKALWL